MDTVPGHVHKQIKRIVSVATRPSQEFHQWQQNEKQTTKIESGRQQNTWLLKAAAVGPWNCNCLEQGKKSKRKFRPWHSSDDTDTSKRMHLNEVIMQMSHWKRSVMKSLRPIAQLHVRTAVLCHHKHNLETFLAAHYAFK